MKLHNELILRFEQPLWAFNPELALFDTILERKPDLIGSMAIEITKGLKSGKLGRKDTPTVEQIVRAAIFKEFKKLTYRELEIAQYENLTCKLFLKLDERPPFSYSTLQKYISKISEKSIRELIIYINTQAIAENCESVEKVSPDTTVVETNVHYPTNNSLVWDCLKTATHLLHQYNEKTNESGEKDKKRQERLSVAKKLNYQINNTSTKALQKPLFESYLPILNSLIKDVVVVLLLLDHQSIKPLNTLKTLLPVMQKVYDNSYRFQILDKKVNNSDKIFSIYEQHTNIIVKGSRDYEFGHKVMITRGTNNFILDYEVYEGNPGDSTLYQQTIGNVIKNYTIIPHSTSSDGGFASNDNLNWSAEQGIVNTVFTKVTKSMKNIVENETVEKMLKKWRGGTEAVISNLKRGFDLRRVLWEGFEKFCAKVAWSVLCYNLRVFCKSFI